MESVTHIHKMIPLRGQIQSNAVALLSLTVALASFSYTTWWAETHRDESHNFLRDHAQLTAGVMHFANNRDKS